MIDGVKRENGIERQKLMDDNKALVDDNDLWQESHRRISAKPKYKRLKEMCLQYAINQNKRLCIHGLVSFLELKKKSTVVATSLIFWAGVKVKFEKVGVLRFLLLDSDTEQLVMQDIWIDTYSVYNCINVLFLSKFVLFEFKQSWKNWPSVGQILRVGHMIGRTNDLFSLE